MLSSARAWSTVCLFAWVGCFSESSDTDDDDADDDTTVGSTDPTVTTTIDPSLTTSTTTMPTATSIDPTSETDPSVDSSGTTDTDPSTTTDPTGGCPAVGDRACNDDVPVAGELCFLDPEGPNSGLEQIGDLAIGDLDGDGSPDLAFSDGGDGYVSFNSEGTLQNATPVVGLMATWSVAITPLGRDGEIAAVFGMAGAEVIIVRFTGEMFVADTALGAPGDFVTVRIADFDGDNAPDLVVGAESSTSLFIYENDHLGAFDQYEEFGIGGVAGVADMRVIYDAATESLGVAVLTVDGRLVVAPAGDGQIGGFVQVDLFNTFGNPTQGMLAAGDLDADGDTDLAVAADGRAFVYRATGMNFADPEQLGENVMIDVAAAIADVDNDGLPDVLLADPADEAIAIWLADEGGFMPASAIPVMSEPRGIGVADFNGDCVPDVAALGPNWFEVAQSNP